MRTSRNKPSRPPESGPKESWVVVEQAGAEADAALVVGFLESEGIPAGSYDRSFHQAPAQNQELSGIDIAVPASRAEEAEKVLAERKREFLGARGEETILTENGLVSIDVGTVQPEPSPADEHARAVEDGILSAIEEEAERTGPEGLQIEAVEEMPVPEEESALDVPRVPESPPHLRTVRQHVREHPVALVVLSLGAGILLGLLARPRR